MKDSILSWGELALCLKGQRASGETKRYCDAASHLEYGLTNFSPVESEQSLKEVQQAFEAAKSHVGLLRVTSSANAEIRIDERAVGIAPLQGLVFVEPGKYTVEARLGDETVQRPVTAAAGKEYSLELTFSLVQNAPALAIDPAAPVEPSTTAPPIAIEQKKESSIVPIIFGGALLALGVGTVIGFKLDEQAQRRDADKLRAAIGPNGCVNAALHSNDCQSLVDSSKTIDHDRSWVAAGLIIASVAAIATPLYWFWPRSPGHNPSRTSSIQFRSGVGPNGATVLVSGEF